jgi:hypothetical protein
VFRVPVGEFEDRSGDRQAHVRGGGMMQGEEEMRIRMLGRQVPCVALLILTVALILGQSRPAGAVEAGEPAPEFKLASTNGVDISLSDFKGKKWVFLEFYALDFQPA